MDDFQYHAPSSVDGVLSALRGADEGKVLAGGMSLLPIMKLDMAMPSDLVSLRNVPGLGEIEDHGHCLKIGALCTHAQVAASSVVQERIPALAQMAGRIGDPQVRNRGTIGGSVAHNDPAADYPAVCVGLDATIITDRRKISSDDFFGGMFETALDEDELVTAVCFPIAECAAYAKFENPASKYAVAGVLVAKGSDGVRVAVTGAGEGVFRVAEMEAALGDSFSADAIAGISVSSDGLLSDNAAGAEYRAHLIGVMARRAVEACG